MKVIYVISKQTLCYFKNDMLKYCNVNKINRTFGSSLYIYLRKVADLFQIFSKFIISLPKILVRNICITLSSSSFVHDLFMNLGRKMKF